MAICSDLDRNGVRWIEPAESWSWRVLDEVAVDLRAGEPA
jgi:hypothetical protein